MDDNDKLFGILNGFNNFSYLQSNTINIVPFVY